MNTNDPVDVVVQFIESINRRDFESLRELMAHDHEMIDENGNVHKGKDVSIAMIREYTEKWPDFQIHICGIHLTQDAVVVIGRTTGSCADRTPGEEIRDRLIYAFGIRGGFVSSFRYALADTQATRRELDLGDANRITR
jgi:limonene-1,2-epoxide hydrolase